ncbi:hypothetical protein EVAR_21429_1 [Eumeta japonica]|uniref:Reverse transcriptase domain-containing protein n=1 Tax=Eumeta variegata TaxID=151549 RepID=A0A4C1VJ07_EUMVA|nr:hypothetical protein EVAR_21429_1 [Eumeta japonica]
MDELSVSCLLYANDQVILAPSACRLQVKKNESRINEGRCDHCVVYVKCLRKTTGWKNNNVRERCDLKEDKVTRLGREKRELYILVPRDWSKERRIYNDTKWQNKIKLRMHVLQTCVAHAMYEQPRSDVLYN